jgi:hypothetical protein
MSYTARCSELRERLERARLLLYLIELGIGDAEQALREDSGTSLGSTTSGLGE